MLKIKFETATLVDAVMKAGRFAPTKGAALDKAGGVVIDVQKDGQLAWVLATDLDNSIVRTIRPTEVLETDDVEVRWRMSTPPLLGVFGGLPVETGGRMVLWAEDPQWLHIECGRIKAKLALYDPMMPYPDHFTEDFSGEELGDVENFAHKVGQISWAVDPKREALAGIHLTGNFAYATNLVSVARVPLDCPVDAPVTVAIDSAGALLRDYPEIALRATEDELQIGVDEDTQVTCRLLKGAFPPMDKIFAENIPDSIILERARVLAALARCTAPFTDKMPRVLVEIRAETITFTMASVEQGKISDEIDHGQNSKDCDLWLTPIDFRNMLEGAGDDRLELFYHGGEMPSLKLIKVVDRQGYVALTMPRKP
jgi:hypothetical protein